jgi:hypothetical protein
MLFWLQRNSLSSSAEHKAIIEPCLEELILLLGNVCLEHPANTSMVSFGLSDSLLKRLVKLPFDYFIHPRKQSILLPTLIILCMDSKFSNRLIIEDALSLDFLGMYIDTMTDKSELELRIPAVLLQQFSATLV